MADEEDLESLLARHKKEQKALVSQITSLKKTVTKGEKAKRKEVLLEVEQLEKGLGDRHQQELREIKIRGDVPKESTIPPAVSEREEESIQADPTEGLQRLKLDEIPTAGKKNTGGKTKMNRQAARLVNPYKHKYRHCRRREGRRKWKNREELRPKKRRRCLISVLWRTRPCRKYFKSTTWRKRTYAPTGIVFMLHLRLN
jgi:hypothetical protein